MTNPNPPVDSPCACITPRKLVYVTVQPLCGDAPPDRFVLYWRGPVAPLDPLAPITWSTYVLNPAYG
ncbi:MAG TPA: hypothetical protein VGE52_03765, partial [Pirellulales bacterium]